MDNDYIPEYAYTLSEGAEKVFPLVLQLVQNSIYSQNIFETDTWQPANEKNLAVELQILSFLVNKNSKIVNPENFTKLLQFTEEKKSCILMPEHYSNFDLPALFYLINTQYPELKPIIQKTISLSASKLNAESKVVLAFTEAFNRIMIYPARSKTEDKSKLTPEQLKEQLQLESINQKAIKAMLTAKDDGKLILMFPSGTRFRPNMPETRNALEQSASFLKRFEYVCFIGIAGNTLRVNPNNHMAEDVLCEDTMVYWIDEPMSSKEFMNRVDGGKANKHGVSTLITEYLVELHKKAEKVRADLVADTPPRFLGTITSPIGVQNAIKKHNLNINLEQIKKFF